MQFLVADMHGRWGWTDVPAWLASWADALTAYRDDPSTQLYGHYLDEIRIRVNGGTRDATGRPARGEQP